MKYKPKKNRKEVTLDRYEKCLILIARHLERCPYNEYKVEEQVLEELGLEKEPTRHKPL